MASTYTLITSQTLSGSAASVTFSSIPSTYTDLVIRVSARSDRGSGFGLASINVNSSGMNISCTYLYSQYSGGTASSGRDSAATTAGLGWIDAASQTSNTFASGEIYIPNYASTTLTKPFSSILMAENNASDGYGWAQASFANSTSAISTITLSQIFGASFVSGSSFYLYGIKNS